MNAIDRAKQIDRLCILTDLVLVSRLTALQAASAARAASLARLADLDVPLQAPDLPEVAAADVMLRYQRWADQRRADINLTLARQTAAWTEARESATLAFARSQALQGLARKLK